MTSEAVLNGFDLLINPSKRGSSDASSVASSLRSSRDGGGLERRLSVTMSSHPPDATVGLSDLHYQAPQQVQISTGPAMQSQMMRPQSPMRPPQQQRAPSSAPSSADEEEEFEDEEEGSGSGDEEEEEEEEEAGSSFAGDEDEEEPQRRRVPRLTPAETLARKRELLHQLERLERKGAVLPRRFTLDDPLEDMQAEYDRIKLDRELDLSVKFQRRILMTCITGIELLNKNFDPFDVKLNGWSDNIHENLPEYDEVFEDLHIKYRGKAKMAPELKLLMMVGGSGVMFHMTSSMFSQAKAKSPDIEEVMRKNPELRRQFQQATAAHVQEQQQRKQGGGGGGGLLGFIGSMFGGGGSGGNSGSRGGGASPVPMPSTPMHPMAPQGGATMRGPKPVDHVLRELHREAFPGGSMHHPSNSQQQQQQRNYPQQVQQQQQGSSNNARIEIISNTSDSELSELPDDAVSNLGDSGPRGGANGRNGARRGGPRTRGVRNGTK
jgi:hypothetical protein